MTREIDDLLPYSLDQLNERDKKKIEAQCKKDPESNESLREINNILETIALSEKPIAPSMDLKQTLMASLNAKTPLQGFVDRFMKRFDLQRSDVEGLFNKLVNSPETLFESSPLPKTTLFYFDGGPKVAHATCGLVKIKAGSVFPAHRHLGKEWMLILQGTAINNEGIQHLPGDTIFSDKGSRHALRIGKQEDFIFAVVLEEPNKWLLGSSIMDKLFPNIRFKKRL